MHPRSTAESRLKLARLAVAAFAIPCLFAVQSLSVATEQTNLDQLHERIAELTPEFVVRAELLSGQVRLVGCDIPKSGTVDVKAASRCYVTVYFEFLPEAPSPFDRELMVSLGEIDIARIPIRVERPRPGDVVKRELALYIPRHAPSVATNLRAGFVEEGSPGESRRVSLSWNMAPLISINVEAAEPVLEMAPDRKRALLSRVARRDARNLVRNGGFEEALRQWSIHKNVLEGLDGWSRILNISTDYEVVIEGQTSLRIDFGGGQDPDFFNIGQNVNAKSSAEYVVSYFIKAQNVTSNEGPSIVIRDPDLAVGEFYEATPRELRLTGTYDWTPIEFTVTTEPTTTRLRVVIRRHGSGSDRYDPGRFGPVSGTVWFDGIRLIER